MFVYSCCCARTWLSIIQLAQYHYRFRLLNRRHGFYRSDGIENSWSGYTSPYKCIVTSLAVRMYTVLSIRSCQIDGDVVFFDGTVFERLDEGVLCRYLQVTGPKNSLFVCNNENEIAAVWCVTPKSCTGVDKSEGEYRSVFWTINRRRGFRAASPCLRRLILTPKTHGHTVFQRQILGVPKQDWPRCTCMCKKPRDLCTIDQGRMGCA